MLRHVIEGTTTEKGISEYLVLLSVFETCEFQERQFSRFPTLRFKKHRRFCERPKEAAPPGNDLENRPSKRGNWLPLLTVHILPRHIS
jgi:hypothetical protein